MGFSSWTRKGAIANVAQERERSWFGLTPALVNRRSGTVVIAAGFRPDSVLNTETLTASTSFLSLRRVTQTGETDPS